MITEGKSIQFRAEALNAFNHPYFPSPIMTATTAQSEKKRGSGRSTPRPRISTRAGCN
jgi:hypothetical protein